jgi:hypothetical protein
MSARGKQKAKRKKAKAEAKAHGIQKNKKQR